MNKFEIAKGYESAAPALPVRKTRDSAGYDLAAAEDIIIPPYNYLMNEIVSYRGISQINDPVTLDEMKEITKAANAKPTLVPTGLKCQLDENHYLKLVVRSSCPLNYWLLLANSTAIIDRDYYGNPINDGNIYLQMINLSPLPIIIRKGEAIGQAIICRYGVTDDDVASGERIGGFGSTDQK